MESIRRIEKSVAEPFKPKINPQSSKIKRTVDDLYEWNKIKTERNDRSKSACKVRETKLREFNGNSDTSKRTSTPNKFSNRIKNQDSKTSFISTGKIKAKKEKTIKSKESKEKKSDLYLQEKCIELNIEPSKKNEKVSYNYNIQGNQISSKRKIINEDNECSEYNTYNKGCYLDNLLEGNPFLKNTPQGFGSLLNKNPNLLEDPPSRKYSEYNNVHYSTNNNRNKITNLNYVESNLSIHEEDIEKYIKNNSNFNLREDLDKNENFIKSLEADQNKPINNIKQVSTPTNSMNYYNIKKEAKIIDKTSQNITSNPNQFQVNIQANKLSKDIIKESINVREQLNMFYKHKQKS